MREIKFRVRDEVTKQVIGYEALFPTEPDNSVFNWCCSHNDRDWSPGMMYTGQSLLREQYTGLKDKNDVEIYEGDLIKCNYCDTRVGEVFYLKEMTRFDLAWRGRDCGNCRHTKIGNWSAVIGDIYQNPELLAN